MADFPQKSFFFKLAFVCFQFHLFSPALFWIGVIWPKSKRPKSQILCHKNISPRDLYNMTLLLVHILLPNIRVTKVDSKVCATEGASAQLQIWIFKFWPYGQLRAVLKKVLGPIMSK